MTCMKLFLKEYVFFLNEKQSSKVVYKPNAIFVGQSGQGSTDKKLFLLAVGTGAGAPRVWL